MTGTPEWFQVFDMYGVCIYELIAYTTDGAIRDARERGYTDAASAKRLFRNPDYQIED